MTVVIGTAGHIDHGKTTLLRALTGIDADRLPDERRRGMTIDVGYAHLLLDDGTALDFVDVPGHDRLVGNMLVGAGEIDAVLLVVAADDGPRAQTLEHLSLLDALGLDDGVAVITKVDGVDPDRCEQVADEVRALLTPTRLTGFPLVAVSSLAGTGLPELGAALAGLARRVAARTQGRSRPGDGARLAVDRAFAVRGRGLVVTGSLRGGSVAAGDHLWLLPADRVVRVREVQVHGRGVPAASGGRTALALAAVEPGEVARGDVLTADPTVVATDRLLVVLERPAVPAPVRRPTAWPPRDGIRARLHLGTADVEATVGRAGRDALDLPGGRALAIVRLVRPVAAAAGDRLLVRRPSPGGLLAGGVVLDAAPTRGVSRRRQTRERVANLDAAVASGDRARVAEARLDLHGAIPTIPSSTASPERAGGSTLAPDLHRAAADAAQAAVTGWHASHPADAGMPLPALRAVLVRTLRCWVSLAPDAAATAVDGVVAAVVAEGRLLREGDRLRRPEHRPPGPDPAALAAMDRLEAALTSAAPPSLAAAAAAAGCPSDGVRALERAGRIVVLEPDLAWAAASYRELAARALVMAHRGPLTPAAYRDATGTSRRYSLAILEDLGRRGILRRTDAGHLPGPKAPPLPGVLPPPTSG